MVLELTPQQRAFHERVELFAADIVAPRAPLIDKTGEYPTDVMHAAAGEGLCGVTIPKAWGGLELDYVSYALAIEAIARASATVAVALSVTNSLVAEAIAVAGKDAQRKRWLTPLARGEPMIQLNGNLFARTVVTDGGSEMILLTCLARCGGGPQDTRPRWP